MKHDEGLRWPPFIILHATTNRKHAGVMEGGYDRLRNCARTLGEHDGNNKPLAEGDSVLENVLKMREERVCETRASTVSCGQMRHRLFLVKR
jgi:hypothetical protein